jgi:hypothetical protein
MRTSNSARVVEIPILIVFIVLFQFTSSLVASPITQTPKAACRIEIDNAHISTYLEEFGRGKYVKVNAKSVCDAYQKSVLLTVEIYKMENSNLLVERAPTK